MTRYLSGLLLGWFVANTAHAAIFCVGSAEELTTAFAAAEQDTTTSDEIRIRAGNYAAPAGGWHADIALRGITLAGGYLDADCTVASADASLTVLDGHQAVRPVTIDTSFSQQPPPATRDIVVRGLTFANGSGDRAGGLKISDAGPITIVSILIERNIFRDNAATAYAEDNSAGALLVATDGPDFSGNVFLVVRGNLFAGNRAPQGAAAMLFSNNGIDVSNNTVVDNRSFDTSLVLRSAVATFTLSGINYSNNLFWNNNPDRLDETYDLRADNPFRASISANLFNNDLQNVHGMPASAQGNLAIDPLFADVDFRLAADSQLIDAGLDRPEGGTTPQDLDGSLRQQGLHVDIGAYEHAPDTIFANAFE